MKKNIINHFIEYLSSTFILSYFAFHNIFLVLIGIIFSLYLININFISNIVRSINKNFLTKKGYKELNKNHMSTKSSSTNLKSSKEDTTLTLAETIEELGYIPSMSKNKDNRAV
tara:strand:+ start:696 stop:1037 length:342 start_codon:yes stop_codon:yes gene_type:complete